MLRKASLFVCLIISSLTFAAEKDRGYCGRIIDSTDIKGAKYEYSDKPFSKESPVYLLAIQCDSEPIDKKDTVEKLINSDDIAFAIMRDVGAAPEKVAKFVKNKSQVCVRARWASPGPS